MWWTSPPSSPPMWELRIVALRVVEVSSCRVVGLSGCRVPPGPTRQLDNLTTQQLPPPTQRRHRSRRLRPRNRPRIAADHFVDDGGGLAAPSLQRQDDGEVRPGVEVVG